MGLPSDSGVDRKYNEALSLDVVLVCEQTLILTRTKAPWRYSKVDQQQRHTGLCGDSNWRDQSRDKGVKDRLWRSSGTSSGTVVNFLDRLNSTNMTSFRRIRLLVAKPHSAHLVRMRETKIMVLSCSGISSVESPILRIPGGSWDRGIGLPMQLDVRKVPAKNDRGCSEAFSLYPQMFFLTNMQKAFYYGHRRSPASKKKAGVQPFPIVDIV
jgi:hypothetical protein